jgi:hypothetical protein
MKHIKLFENYDKFQPLNPWEEIYDFAKDEQFHNIFYSDNHSDKELKEFKKKLRKNKGEDYVLMYHGTSCNNPIMEQGIKRTKNSTKKSLQSQTGYVYLTVYPTMAKTFAETAYPYDDVCVYQVFVKIKDLKPDTDQLKNKRMWGDQNIGSTLTDSLIHGRGARVKRDIMPYEIKKIDV